MLALRTIARISQSLSLVAIRAASVERVDCAVGDTGSIYSGRFLGMAPHPLPLNGVTGRKYFARRRRETHQ